MRGWMILVLLMLGIGQLVLTGCKPATVEASESPTVVMIEDVDGAAQQAIEPPPVVESTGPTIDQRVSALESQVVTLAENDVKTLEAFDRGQENTTQAIGLVRDVVDQVQKLKQIDDAIVAKVKELQDRLAPRKPELKAAQPEPAKPPSPAAAAAPPKSAQVPAKRIVMETMDTEQTGMQCAPCEDWKADEMPLAVADGYTVEVVPAPGSVPRFTVFHGHLFVRQQGFMSRQRLKDIERALQAEWARVRR